MTTTSVSLGLLASFLMAAGASASQQWLKELRQYVGQEHRVCGKVAGYQIGAKPASGDCNIAKLTFGSSSESEFYVSIPDTSGALPGRTVLQYATHDICVTGTLDVDDKNVMNIVAARPGQIEVTDHRPMVPFGTGAHLLCEAGMAKPELVHAVRAKYTREMMQAGVQGDVMIDVVIGVDGAVADARVLDGRYREMNDQALNAVRQWRFRPAELNGTPVSTVALVDVPFRLR